MGAIVGASAQLASGISGALGGWDGNKSSGTQNQTTTPVLSQEADGSRIMSGQALQNYGKLAQSQSPFTNLGPSQYAQMLQQYSQTGGLPNQQQIGSANQYAQNIFAPQQAALNNTFTQANIDNNRQAAAMGRSINDPILAAKLAQYQGQQQQVLSGQQTQLASQTAMQLPQQQLGFAQALSNQAFINQGQLVALGNQVQGVNDAYALSAAGHSQNFSGVTGGGFGGAVSGGFNGLAGGTKLANAFGAFNSGPPQSYPELQNYNPYSGGAASYGNDFAGSGFSGGWDSIGENAGSLGESAFSYLA